MAESKTYIAMSDDGIDALVQAITAYASRDDAGAVGVTIPTKELSVFVRALQQAYEHTADMGCEGADIDLEDEDAGRWAAEMVANIADSYDVEFI